MHSLGSVGLILIGVAIAFVAVIIALGIVTIGAPETPKEKK